MGIKKRFLKTFLCALITGLFYGLIAIVIDDIAIPYLNEGLPPTHAVHFHMSVDIANKLLIELIGYAVLIYGFFAAFLIYTISGIPKFSDGECGGYKKVILEKMNLFVWITGFIVDFLFFSLMSIYWLEAQKHACLDKALNDLPASAAAFSGLFADMPANAPAYVLFFMLIISLLGYLVFSLVIGMLQVRTEKNEHNANTKALHGRIHDLEDALQCKTIEEARKKAGVGEI